ncbi:PREDICTED: uncharacterized protein LOC107164239 [Diuraphis noxia]|uniref:uncharacterized protein LOC107164239 n=1 Tax=Diuraphis noxia TaxID=143948 RepID=UPI000763592B|nr:PREDICTED: uncharacterized protein LOC107164239 [Diuraphis noxia]
MTAAAVLLRLRGGGGGGGGVDQPVTATSGDDDDVAGRRGSAGCACRSLAALPHLTILRSLQPPSCRALLPPAAVTVADVMTQQGTQGGNSAVGTRFNNNVREWRNDLQCRQ